MSPYSFPPLAACLVVTVLGSFVLSRHPTHPLNQTFAAFTLTTAGWLVTLGVAYSLAPGRTLLILLLMRLCFTSVVCIPVPFLRLTALTVGTWWAHAWTVLSAGVAAFFAVTIWTTDWLVAGVRIHHFGPYPRAGWLHPVMLGWVALSLAFIHVPLVRAWRRPDLDPRTRLQVRDLSIALVVYTPAVIDFLPNYDVDVYPIGAVFVVAFAATATYAIVRHQLLDIRVAITRTGLLLGTYLVVLGGPIALAAWGRGWLDRALGEHWWIVPMGLSTGLATAGPFTYAYLRHQAERLLLRELARTRREATRDGLTGLLVRRAFETRATAALREAATGGEACAILMIDLDHFKAANDTYGHQVGDAVLRETARRLAHTLRPGELLGRYGGEEFICLLGRVDMIQARVIAERLRERVAATPIVVNGASVAQTVSIGLAMAPDDGTSLDTLTGRADQALYAAKRAGRNRVGPVS